MVFYNVYLILCFKLTVVATLAQYSRYSFEILSNIPRSSSNVLGLCIVFWGFVYFCCVSGALYSLLGALFSPSGLCIVFWGGPDSSLSLPPPRGGNIKRQRKSEARNQVSICDFLFAERITKHLHCSKGRYPYIGSRVP